MSAVKKSHKLPRMEVPTVCEWCADDSGRVQRLHGEMLCGSCRHISRTKLVKLRQGDSFLPLSGVGEQRNRKPV